MLGTFEGDDKKAILILKKTAWPEDLVTTMDWHKKRNIVKMEQYFHNNEFRKHWFVLADRSELNKN